MKSITEYKVNLERLKEEKNYYESKLKVDWVATELNINPYLTDRQKQVIKFKERVAKDEYKVKLNQVINLIDRISSKIKNLEINKINDARQEEDVYINKLCSFKKSDNKYIGTVCFEIGLKSFDTVEDIKEYLKSNKQKIINMHDKHFIPDLFGNSIIITREQVEYAKTL